MLYEDDVTDAVAAELVRRGWTIRQQLRATERGDDIVASRDGETLVVECKGETSSKATSSRHGLAFSSGQVNSHVSRAMLRAMRVVSDGDRGAVAFPKERFHRVEVAKVKIAADRLGVAVCWVDSSRSVVIETAPGFDV